MKRRQHQAGFTLIELLVVIAIIGLLGSAILAATGGSRSKSRDANRTVNLKEMAKALVLADADPEKALTGCTGAGTSISPDAATNNVTACSGPAPVNFAKYKDPTTSGTLCNTSSAGTCQYMIALRTGAAGPPTTQNFEICTYLENGSALYSGGSAATHIVRIDSLSGGSIVAGCN